MRHTMTSRLSGKRAVSLGSTLLGTFATMGLGVVSGMLLARYLGPENRGTLASILLWPYIVTHVGDLGGPSAYVYASAVSESEQERLQKDALSIALLQSIPLVIISWLVILVVASNQYLPIALSMTYCAASVPLNLCTRYLNAVNQGRRNFGRFAITRAAMQVGYTSILSILAILGHITVTSAVISMILAHFVWFSVALTTRCLKTPFSKFPSRHTLSVINGYGIRSHIGNLAPIEFLQLDLAAVAIMLGSVSTGLYSVAASTSMVLRAVGVAVGLMLMPAAAATTNPDLRRRMIFSTVQTSVVILALATLAAFFVAPRLIPLLFGEDFSESVKLFQLLVLGVAIASLKQVIGDASRGLGLPTNSSKAEAASLVFFCISVWPLAHHFGTYGVAICAASSYSISLAINLVLLSAAGFPLRRLLVASPNDISWLFSFSRVHEVPVVSSVEARRD